MSTFLCPFTLHTSRVHAKLCHGRITYILVSEFLFDLRLADKHAGNRTDTSHPSFVDSYGRDSLHFAGGLIEFGHDISHSFLGNPGGSWSETEREHIVDGFDKDGGADEAGPSRRA